MNRLIGLFRTLTRALYTAVSRPARDVRSFFFRSGIVARRRKRPVAEAASRPSRTPWGEFWSDDDEESATDRLIKPRTSAPPSQDTSRPWYESLRSSEGAPHPSPQTNDPDQDAGETIREFELPTDTREPAAPEVIALPPTSPVTLDRSLAPSIARELPPPPSSGKPAVRSPKQRAALRRKAKRLRRLLTQALPTTAWPEISDNSAIAGLVSDMRSTVAAEASGAFERAGGTRAEGFNTILITRAVGAKRAVELVGLLQALSAIDPADASEIGDLLADAARRGWLLPQRAGSPSNQSFDTSPRR